jgi:hypothetical protein
MTCLREAIPRNPLRRWFAVSGEWNRNREQARRARVKELVAAGLSASQAKALADTKVGPCRVELVKVPAGDNQALGLVNSVGFEQGMSVIQRVRHLGPVVVATGVSIPDAVRLKERLEQRGGAAKITEVSLPRRDGSRRAIPSHVRHDVWRRDSGQCVDCRSRENLEFDHIIPWSKGGADTARNLELRCQVCNRAKGAKI